MCCLEKNIALFILLSCYFFVNCTERDYCNPNICSDTKEHTLCRFQLPGPAAHCISYERTLTSKKDKQDLLDKINNRRNKVAGGEIRSLPAAQSMLKLEWSEELALSAQRWADQCVRQRAHDVPDTCRDVENLSVAQNIATIYGESPGLTPSSLVDLWYMELLNVNSSVLSWYRPSSTTDLHSYDYFTQLVWSDTSLVGCGGVKFKEQTQEFGLEKNRTVYRLVCNFAPSGNRVGESVYIAGVLCSRCPKDYSCDSDYKALCSNRKPSEHFKLETFINSTEKSITNSKIVVITDNDTTENLTNTNNLNTDHFDLLSHLFEFSTSPEYRTTKTTVKCKDVIAVDDFVELLKSKINTEQLIKEILFAPKTVNIESLSDETVSAIVQKLYSRNLPTTTTVSTKSEEINSTLLADLVEAVIFRHSDGFATTENIQLRTQIIPEVSAVKIQAQIGEIKLNNEFTGHYFFPEEDVVDEDSHTDEQLENEKTDIYDDVPNLPLSEIAFEIEELKQKQTTQDFLDEILESDFLSESVTKKNFLTTNIAIEDRVINESEVIHTDIKRLKRSKSKCASKTTKVGKTFVNYNELLQKLASDVKYLKLNERYNCATNKAFNYNSKCLSIILRLLYIKYSFYNA